MKDPPQPNFPCILTTCALVDIVSGTEESHAAYTTGKFGREYKCVGGTRPGHWPVSSVHLDTRLSMSHLA